jgi:hypothetical protein
MKVIEDTYETCYLQLIETVNKIKLAGLKYRDEEIHIDVSRIRDI